jgi:hypothetical protein
MREMVGSTQSESIATWRDRKRDTCRTRRHATYTPTKLGPNPETKTEIAKLLRPLPPPRPTDEDAHEALRPGMEVGDRVIEADEGEEGDQAGRGQAGDEVEEAPGLRHSREKEPKYMRDSALSTSLLSTLPGSLQDLPLCPSSRPPPRPPPTPSPLPPAGSPPSRTFG